MYQLWLDTVHMDTSLCVGASLMRLLSAHVGVKYANNVIIQPLMFNESDWLQSRIKVASFTSGRCYAHALWVMPAGMWKPAFQGDVGGRDAARD